jgi:putative ABC transport system ATP-binding protein
METLLKIDGLIKSYGQVAVLAGVSLTLDRGQTLALTGESGSGKSTLLHLAAALDTPDGGSVLLDGDEIHRLDDAGRAAARRDKIGLVFQQFNLIPSLNVAQNIAFQARLAGRHDAQRCAMLAERLGIADLTRRYPENLSGGQQQRVAIARALANRPALILADEPTGNLDEATGDAVMDLLLDLVRDTGAALMMVTHSTRLAARLDRRLHLSRGQLSPVGHGA